MTDLDSRLQELELELQVGKKDSEIAALGAKVSSLQQELDLEKQLRKKESEIAALQAKARELEFVKLLRDKDCEIEALQARADELEQSKTNSAAQPESETNQRMDQVNDLQVLPLPIKDRSNPDLGTRTPDTGTHTPSSGTSGSTPRLTPCLQPNDMDQLAWETTPSPWPNLECVPPPDGFIRMVEANSLESIGSEYHAQGGCKPCAWIYKPSGCRKGKDCDHCHLCPENEITNRRKNKVSAIRMGALRKDKGKQISELRIFRLVQ